MCVNPNYLKLTNYQAYVDIGNNMGFATYSQASVFITIHRIWPKTSNLGSTRQPAILNFLPKMKPKNTALITLCSINVDLAKNAGLFIVQQ